MIKKLLSFSLLCLIAVAVTGCGKNKETASSEPIANDLETLTVDGYADLKEKYKGKLMIINFFASWCPPCKAETPDFVSVYNEFKDGNFVIVGVSIDDDKQDAVKFVNDYRITYPVYMADPALQRKYNVSKIPTSFVYGPDGKLANIAEGIISGPLLKKMAQSVAEAR